MNLNLKLVRKIKTPAAATLANENLEEFIRTDQQYILQIFEN